MKPSQATTFMDRYDYFMAMAMVGFIQRDYKAEDAVFWAKKAADKAVELTADMFSVKNCESPKSETKAKKA